MTIPASAPGVFLAALLAAAALTPLARIAGRRAGAVAHPVDDRWSRREVPVLGGAAIWIATVTVSIAWGVASPHAVVALSIGTVFFALGLVDDFMRLRPGAKLAIQFIIGCGGVFFGAAGTWTGAPALDALLSIGWLVLAPNAFNLLDNIDGLCAGTAAIASVWFAASVAPSEPALAILALALAGACVGFLVYNFHPASIFMGDSGSLAIGGTLAALTIGATHAVSVGVVSSIAFPLFLLLLPIFDTAFVTIVRRLSARPASVGGRDHTSHRLVVMGLSEARAVTFLYGVAAAGGAAALAFSHGAEREGLVLGGALALGLGLLAVRLARVEVYGGEEDFSLLRDKRYVPLLSLAQRRRAVEVLLDVALLAFAYYVSYVFRFGDQFPVYHDMFVRSLPIVIASGLASFLVTGVYAGLWRYFTLSDLGPYVRGVVLASVSTVLVLVYVYRFEGYSRGVFAINVVVLGGMVIGARLSFRAFGEFVDRHRASGRRTLVYGAGDAGALVLREIHGNPRRLCHVVGFVDDDPAKLRRRIGGVPVLGGGERLDEVVRAVGAEVIVVSTRLPQDRLDHVIGCARATGLTVLELEIELREIPAGYAAGRDPAVETQVSGR